MDKGQKLMNNRKLAKKLKESEDRYKRLVESVTDYIYHVEVEDGQPVSTIHGPACVAVTGYKTQEYEADPYLWYRMVHEEDRDAVSEQASRILSGETVSPLEHRIIHKDGSIRWVKNAPVPQYDGQGCLVAYDGLIADITERKQAEEALRESEERYRKLFEESRDAIIATQDNKIIAANQAALDLFGYVREEMIGLDVRKIDVYPGERFRFQQEMEQKGFVRDYEVKLRKKDGTEIDCLLTSTVRRALDDSILGYQGIIHDITQRKALEEVWRRYEFIVNTSKDFMTLIDRNHTYVAVNEAYCKVHNKIRTEMIGEPVATVWGEERYQTQIKPYLDKCLSGEEAHYQGWFQVANLGRRCFDVAYYPYYAKDGTVTHAVVVSRDITKRRWAEEEVQRRNRELILLNQVIAASVTRLEPEVILETTCRELAQAFDVPRSTATLLNEDTMTAVVVAEYLAEDQPTILRNTIPVMNDSSFQYLLNHQTPLVVNDAQNDPRLEQIPELMHKCSTASLLLLPLVIEDRVVGSLGLETVEPRSFSTAEVNLAWSVADQVGGALARAWLDKEHRRLSTAIEQTVDSVIITDTKGTIVYVNPAFEQVSGYNRHEVIGQNSRILKSGKQDVAFYEKLWKTVSAGQVWHGRFINKKKDGTFYTLDATITPVRDEDDKVVNYVALQRDVTRELQLEDQLRQSQKMEAIGRLAGGVAHDFNNILTVINGHSELLLQRYLDSNDPMRWEVEQIQEAGERAAVLTHQLLAFSRRQSSQPQLLNLNEVITSLQKMVQRLIGENIKLGIKLEPTLGLVKADAGQMEQVLMNLIVNARDAMPQGGKLTIETANVDLDETYTEQHLEMTPGPYVLLTVTDTGVGFDTETQTHIFEPFFTTKESGKGTGLGLSTVYGIIHQSNGDIWVYSELEKGTTFKIYLPQITEEADEEVVSSPTPVKSLEGTETILLVEDEANVRLVARKFLQKKGYTVLEAGHPKKALQICQQHEEQIDLLITDVIMPDMSGRELAERLSRNFSNLKVLYISGYANEALDQQGLLGSGIAFLEKPFSSDALARKVREVLNAP
jgi:PAS domain S-box-containing protein